jgi:hypothetical protein
VNVFESRRFWLITAMLAVVAVAVGMLVGKPSSAGSRAQEGGNQTLTDQGHCTDMGDPGGPLQMEGAALTLGSSQLTEVGRPVGYRQLVTCNVGDRPLTLRRAWLVHKQPGLMLLGFATVDGINTQDTEWGFPPTKGSPLAGRTVKPGEIVNIDIGTALPTGGHQAFRGLAVRYTDGSESFIKVFDVSLRLCGPTKEFDQPGGCPTPIDAPSQRCLLPQDPTPDENLSVCKQKD